MRRPFVLNFAAFSRHIFEENNKNPSDPKHCTQIIGLLSRLQKRQELISMEYAFLLLPDASILFAFISTVESCECFEEEQPVDWPICIWIGNSVHSIFFTFFCQTIFQNTNCRYLVSCKYGNLYFHSSVLCFENFAICQALNLHSFAGEMLDNPSSSNFVTWHTILHHLAKRQYVASALLSTSCS